MNIWLITVGEPLPTDPGSQRLYRCGILAELMAKAGHDVTWWTSTFDHVAKRHRHAGFAEERIRPGYRILQLHGCAYRRNVSLARLRNHRQIASEFATKARELPVPDVILCSYPTIELCEEAVNFGRARDVPVVLDVRDLWPDIFVKLAPPLLRPLAAVALQGQFRSARNAFRGAAAVIGTTDAFAEWGVAYAGRARSGDDAAFPMAYDSAPAAAADLAEAGRQWNERGIDGRSFTAVFFGTLGRQFDIDAVIRAARRLEHEAIRFVLCGNGDSLGQYRATAAGMSNILFPGWVNAASIQALMQRAHAGLAPYIPNEDFRKSIPNKPIEYMSAGLPVVTSQDGTMRRLIEENACGLFYEHCDDNALAEAVRRLASDEPMRQRLSRNARDLFEREFVADKVYGRLIAHLESIARASRPGHAELEPQAS